MLMLQHVHQYGFLRKKIGSWIFRALFQKVKFTMLPLFPAHVFSLVAVPRKHGVWKSSRYTSWLNMKPSFLILLKWCLKGLSPPCRAKVARCQS